MLGAVHATAGFVLCLVSGWLGYVAILGWFSPMDLLSPTITITLAIPNIAHNWSKPFFDWATSYYNVYLPIILAISALAATRAKVQIPRIRVVLWFSISYVALIFLYRLIASTFVLEQSYYFSYLAPAIFLMLGVTLGSYRIGWPPSRCSAPAPSL